MRAALDTNLLVYAEGFGNTHRVDVTRRVLEQLGYMDAYPVFETNASAWRGAMDLCVRRQRQEQGCCSRKICSQASAGVVCASSIPWPNQRIPCWSSCWLEIATTPPPPVHPGLNLKV